MRDDLKGRSAAEPLPNRRLVMLVLVAMPLLAILGWWLYVTFLQSEEDKIRAALEATLQGVRDRHPAHVTEILADDFQFMGASKEQIHQGVIHLLMTQFAAADIAAAPEPIPVSLGPDKKTAEAAFSARMRVKYAREGEWVEFKPPGLSVMKFKCRFKLTDKGWKLVGLEPQP